MCVSITASRGALFEDRFVGPHFAAPALFDWAAVPPEERLHAWVSGQYLRPPAVCVSLELDCGQARKAGLFQGNGHVVFAGQVRRSCHPKPSRRCQLPLRVLRSCAFGNQQQGRHHRCQGRSSFLDFTQHIAIMGNRRIHQEQREIFTQGQEKSSELEGRSPGLFCSFQFEDTKPNQARSGDFIYT